MPFKKINPRVYGKLFVVCVPISQVYFNFDVQYARVLIDYKVIIKINSSACQVVRRICTTLLVLEYITWMCLSKVCFLKKRTLCLHKN